jgi:hypothetical protein
MLIAECYAWGADQHPEAIPRAAREWGIPIVRLGACGLEYLPHKAIRANEELLLEQMHYGVQTGESYYGATPEARQWLLQLRWFAENVRSWEDEPGARGGDEITLDRLPRFAVSRRPALTSTPGFVHGFLRQADGAAFSVMYQDPDNERPAQAEVWVDLNDDGRFDPNPAHGERLPMSAASGRYDRGVAYTAKLPPRSLTSGASLRYVFRFADPHWLPPVVGGAVPSNYGHWTAEW